MITLITLITLVLGLNGRWREGITQGKQDFLMLGYSLECRLCLHLHYSSTSAIASANASDQAQASLSSSTKKQVTFPPSLFGGVQFVTAQLSEGSWSTQTPNPLLLRSLVTFLGNHPDNPDNPDKSDKPDNPDNMLL